MVVRLAVRPVVIYVRFVFGSDLHSHSLVAKFNNEESVMKGTEHTSVKQMTMLTYIA